MKLGKHPPLAGPMDLRDASQSLRDRFWSKVRIAGPDECWEWAAYRKSGGYGQFMLEKGKFRTASRVSLALSGVVLGVNEMACHTCDNPPCVNPAHLFPGSQSMNGLDSVSKGRANRSRGAQHLSARLTPDDVRAIRAVPEAYGVTASLAREYGVSWVAIRNVRLRRTWKEVA